MNERNKKLANIWANRRAEDPKLGITYTFSEKALDVFAEEVIKNTPSFLVTKELYEQKFAELILIEVTDILSTYRGKMVFEDGAEYNYEHPIIAIRKHFGVEE